MLVKSLCGVALIALIALPALAQQQPAAPPQSKVDADLDAAGNQLLNTSQQEAIVGPHQLEAAQAFLAALGPWKAEQRQKLTDMAHDNQAKLEAVQKDRQTLAAQIASLNKQLADAKKPDPADKAKIARLADELAQARRECRAPSSSLSHSTPAH